jgi:hypothetical protein
MSSHYNCRILADNCILIQQSVGGSNFFNRTWAEFKIGFADLSGNVWLGNELLQHLTKNNVFKLRFDLQSYETGLWFVAEYSMFTVASEVDNYRLNVAGFSGNASNNAFSRQNRMKFTTKDRDNDQWSGNCAVYNGGGFWYRDCANCGVNAVRGQGESFSWSGLPGGHKLSTSRMWLVSH